MRSTIIGIGGYAGSGKDFVGYELENLGFERLKFADPLYRLAYVLCGYEPQRAERDHEKKWFKTHWHLMKTPWRWVRIPVKGRWLLQWLGTDIMRAAIPGIWVALMAQKLRHPGRYAITDARFADEVDLIRRRGGVWWRLKSIKARHPAGNHASETQQDSIVPDRTFFNHHDDSIIDEVWNEGRMEIKRQENGI